jgi:uncharacterized membrane protein YeaQ/YmgE (transglycosylase-associated protein family)
MLSIILGIVTAIFAIWTLKIFLVNKDEAGIFILIVTILFGYFTYISLFKM